MIECYIWLLSCNSPRPLRDLKTEAVFKFMEFTFELKALGKQTPVGFSFELTIADLRVWFKEMGARLLLTTPLAV